MIGEGTFRCEVHSAIMLNIRKCDFLYVELVPTYFIWEIVRLDASVSLPDLASKCSTFVKIAASENPMFG
jgi:hypothetical protein